MTYNQQRLFIDKAILGEELQWYYLTHSGRYKEDYVNVTACLEFEPVYLEIAVKHFSYFVA